MDNDKAIIYALATDAANRPVVVLGLPAAGWEYIKDGRSQQLNLLNQGGPIILLYGGRDREALLEPLNAMKNPTTRVDLVNAAHTTNSLVMEILREVESSMLLFPNWRPGLAARLAARVNLALARLEKGPL